MTRSNPTSPPSLSLFSLSLSLPLSLPLLLVSLLLSSLPSLLAEEGFPPAPKGYISSSSIPPVPSFLLSPSYSPPDLSSFDDYPNTFAEIPSLSPSPSPPPSAPGPEGGLGLQDFTPAPPGYAFGSIPPTPSFPLLSPSPPPSPPPSPTPSPPLSPPLSSPPSLSPSAPGPEGGIGLQDFPRAPPGYADGSIPPTPSFPPLSPSYPSYNESVIPFASPAEQLVEKKILLEIKSRLGNHPIFSKGNWIEAYYNSSTKEYARDDWLPCSTNFALQWSFLECINGFISALKLDSAFFADPSNPDFVGGNTSWSLTGIDPLKGTIPWDLITKLTNLVGLSVQSTLLEGPILPDNIGDLPNLANIALASNKLNGTIPPSITKLKGLTTFYISGNNVTGSLPENIDELQHLTNFVVYANQLSGGVPKAFGSLTNLQVLDLGQNLFNGSIPEELGNLVNLTNLSLAKAQISVIPESFTKLTSLKYLDLSQNFLSSTFPAWLTNVSSLEILHLEANRFYGPVPSEIWDLRNMTELDISLNYFNGSAPFPKTDGGESRFIFQGNCFSDVTSVQQMRDQRTCYRFYAAINGDDSSPTFPIAAVAVPLAFGFLLLVLLGAYFYWRKRRAEKLEHLFGKNLKQVVKAFSLSELKRATKNFSQVLGRGGYGTVYKAVLKNNSIVAVKRLDQVSKQGDVEFIREVELLSRLHHRHLVNLVGFCAERGERMLVYEYMAMGSLHEHLHGRSSKEYPLSWDSRSKIAIHIALGLEYLHYGADPPLIHRDIKSANILLSDDGYSKVADFGLCKEAPLGADGSETLVPTATAVRGSFGYLDPEYVNTSVLSEKSDVYSYGVVLLELISGHKSIHEWQPLAYWAEEYLADREKTPLMVDPALEGDFDLDELYALCDIARTCVQDQAVLRPTIRDVAKALVENLGHTLSCYGGSVRDSASVLSSSHSETSSNPSTTLDDNNNSQNHSEMSYQQYSETFQWTEKIISDSGKLFSGANPLVSTEKNGTGKADKEAKERKEEKEGKEGKEKESKGKNGGGLEKGEAKGSDDKV